MPYTLGLRSVSEVLVDEDGNVEQLVSVVDILHGLSMY